MKALLQSKGRKYSKVANEIEQNYKNWLDASLRSETYFLNHCNSNKFELLFSFDGSSASISLEDGDWEFVMPLIWEKKSGIDFENFKTDAALLLMYVANKCSNKDSVQKIESFVKSYLL